MHVKKTSCQALCYFIMVTRVITEEIPKLSVDGAACHFKEMFASISTEYNHQKDSM